MPKDQTPRLLDTKPQALHKALCIEIATVVAPALQLAVAAPPVDASEALALARVIFRSGGTVTVPGRALEELAARALRSGRTRRGAAEPGDAGLAPVRAEVVGSPEPIHAAPQAGPL
ncbi:MAG: hypothetical protein ACHP84_20725 [Caulobacterales bacterium]